MKLYLDVAASRFYRTPDGEEPRVVRIAWFADDEPAPHCRLIKPTTDLTIDPATLPYHGASVEQLERDGVPPEGVIAELGAAAGRARTIVTYGAAFHWRNLHRLMGAVGAPQPTQAVCAMEMAKFILRLEGYGGRLKSPSLKETCDHYGVSVRLGEGSPVTIALSTVLALRAVYERMVAEIDGQ